MIALILDAVPFEQDIRELFMAYFPGEAYTHEESADARLTLRVCRQEADAGTVYAGADNAEDDLPGDKGGARRRGIYRLVLTDTDGEYIEGCSCEEETRFDTKCALKLALYHMLAEYTGRKLPWGTLTGIRPTRLFLDMLDDGFDEDETSDAFRRRFEIGEEKLALCREVAVRESTLLEDIDCEAGWSLYIGIPFCPTTCLYCSFTSYPISMWRARTQEYVEALIRDIEQVSMQYRGRRLETVYMGGGTPTSLEADQLRYILDAVHRYNDTSALRELTVEAGRPDSITRDKLMALKESGCSRISVNPQTMKDGTLRAIGRLHTVDMVRERYYLARECGFDNINMDLIAGLPGEGVPQMEDTMREIGRLAPESVTVHTLAVKHKARLGRELPEYAAADAETVAGMLRIADTACREMGLRPYYMYRQKNMAGNFENVGYSAPGRECLYNVLIMEERQAIVGCGAGTSTKLPLGRGAGVTRSAKVRDPGLYIERYAGDGRMAAQPD